MSGERGPYILRFPDFLFLSSFSFLCKICLKPLFPDSLLKHIVIAFQLAKFEDEDPKFLTACLF